MTENQPTAPYVTVVGGGLAGCEAAWTLARLGFRVNLHEMRPGVRSPAHSTGSLAELVCSNSLGSVLPDRAAGILKAEMERLGSLILACAMRARVPAGDALAIDRFRFAGAVEEAIGSQPQISVIPEEVVTIPQGPAIIATGPLTSPGLHRSLSDLITEPCLYFFDALAPIVVGDTVDLAVAYRMNRWQKAGVGGDYLNCPLDREGYYRFIDALLAAPRAPLKEFETTGFFSGCQPIEVIADSGRDSPRFGPMKPVGLPDPSTGRRPFAVVQLRQEKILNDSFNLVGFQTNLTYSAQREIFRLIPGLQEAEFVRLGQMHRNTFVNAPRVLNGDLSLKVRSDLFLAGQITGVEGYMESAAMGLVAALQLARRCRGAPPLQFSPHTAMGSLLRYLVGADPRHFQPMNINFSLFADPGPATDKGDRRRKIGELSNLHIRRIAEELGI